MAGMEGLLEIDTSSPRMAALYTFVAIFLLFGDASPIVGFTIHDELSTVSPLMSRDIVRVIRLLLVLLAATSGSKSRSKLKLTTHTAESRAISVRSRGV